MSTRPRLVYRPGCIERAAGPVREENEHARAPIGVPGIDQARAVSEPTPDALWEVQMENVHPLRLRLLLEIERTRSISAAAQACGIGQPSASMHLRSLETTLGQRLVSRNARGSSLTAAGKVVASHATRMLAALDSMRRAVQALGGRSGGALAIAASLTPSVVLVPPALRHLSDLEPGVTVSIRTVASATAVQQVARGEVDIAVAGEVSCPEPVASEQIALDELIGIAGPGVLDSDDGWISLGQLARNRLLIGHEGSSTRTVTERSLARAGYRAAPAWEFNSYETIIRAVKAGLGVCFISRQLVRHELERNELVAFRVSGVEQMLRPIHALREGSKDLTREAALFLRFLNGDAAGVEGSERAVTSPGPASRAAIGDRDASDRAI